MRPIEEYFSAPLNLIFLSSAPISIDKLDPLELPNLPLALDMYILKDQSLVLTSTWVEDITITLDFKICKTKLHERFSQHISISKQPFDQALVLKNKIFMFIDMNDDQKIYGKKTPDLTRIYTTLQHLIAQEQSFLSQIINFNDMLTKADIFTPVIPRRKRTVSRSSTENHTIITFQRFLSNSHENKRPLNLVKRSTTNIFSPYSLISIRDTARKFNRIHFA